MFRHTNGLAHGQIGRKGDVRRLRVLKRGMRRGAILVRFLLACVPVVASQAWCQTPVGQQDPQLPGQQKPVDPNAKPGDLPDPTKDPLKDPANDPSRDPTKDPDATTPASPLGADTGNIAPEAPDYTGPAILSRGFELSRPAVPVNQHLRFYAGLNATYDSGLIGAYVQDGVVPTINTEGADFNWGASATHYRRKDIFEFNYGGHYYEYYNGSKYSGQDHSFAGGYTRQLSQRFTVGIRETAGLYSNTYSVLNSRRPSRTPAPPVPRLWWLRIRKHSTTGLITPPPPVRLVTVRRPGFPSVLTEPTFW